MSSMVFTHPFRVSLAFGIFYSSQSLHMEVNTSLNYHNINKKLRKVSGDLIKLTLEANMCVV
jgi:hypothetical protein